MYKIKQIPEDFIVKEKIKLEYLQGGEYTYYLLWKKGISTFQAIEQIKSIFRVKHVNAAGLKDKCAITEQYVSVRDGPDKQIDLPHLKLDLQGYGKERLNVGSLDGNHFRITVRNIEKVPNLVETVPNYYDSQRFGIGSGNIAIGEMLIKRKFRDAAILLKNEAAVAEHLASHPADPIGALRKMPKRLLQFYASAYQSYLWNRCIDAFLKENPPVGVSFPLPGFDFETNDKAKENIMASVLVSVGLTARDFAVRQIPEVSLYSHDRQVFVRLEELTIGPLDDDEFNPGRKKCMVSFYLSKGSYATNAIKFMFCES